ncbi:MAG: hypothetical protein LC768_12650 [Acidobacteria bacterium]|nr:hypothetical protein [Acidobacteriota bacterium]MCA1639161.1 hypothetical protein [Acidobacteriota bacterium]
MQKKTSTKKDEIELAKSIFDEIVEETESEDWNKPKNTSAQKGGKVRAAKKAAQGRQEKTDS